jgi:hypothetical protein
VHNLALDCLSCNQPSTCASLVLLPAVQACQHLFAAGLVTPEAVWQAGEDRVRALLAASGYDRAGEQKAMMLPTSNAIAALSVT